MYRGASLMEYKDLLSHTQNKIEHTEFEYKIFHFYYDLFTALRFQFNLQNRYI